MCHLTDFFFLYFFFILFSMSVSAHIVVYILYIHVCISLSALVIQDASVCQPVGEVTQTFGILSVRCFLVSVCLSPSVCFFV